jgi:putative metallohydrolase (TIGR04338 family)
LRDNQRQRLYNAERRALGGLHAGPKDYFKTTTQIEKWLLKNVIGKKWFKENFRITSVKVHPGKGRRNAGGTAYGYQAQLWLPRWARNEYVILHELAHGIVPNGRHGARYAGVYIYLVEKVLGEELAYELRNEFNKGNVDFSFAAIKKW